MWKIFFYTFFLSQIIYKIESGKVFYQIGKVSVQISQKCHLNLDRFWTNLDRNWTNLDGNWYIWTVFEIALTVLCTRCWAIL